MTTSALADDYTVYYDCNGGGEIAEEMEETVTYDGTYMFADGSSMCEWEGHEFTGWYCSNYGAVSAGDETIWDVESEEYCSATWSYKLFYGCDAENPVDLTPGETFTFADAAEMCNSEEYAVPNGYHIVGWNCNGPGLNDSFESGTENTFDPEDDWWSYEIWCEPNGAEKEYTISYDCGNGVIDTQTVTYGDSPDLANGATLCSSGGTFSGWDCSADDGDWQQFYPRQQTINFWNDTGDVTCTPVFVSGSCSTGEYITTNGCETCPTGYTSDGTATSIYECTKAWECPSLSCPSHATGCSYIGATSGVDYYGSANQHCLMSFSCDSGYVKQANIRGMGNSHSWNDNTWTVYYPWGTVFGESLLSSSAAADHSVGFPDTSGQSESYCWCRETGYQLNGQSLQNVSNLWVYSGYPCDGCSIVTCNSWCGLQAKAWWDNSFRTALFGESGNACRGKIYNVYYQNLSYSEYSSYPRYYSIDMGTVNIGNPTRDNKVFAGWCIDSSTCANPIFALTPASVSNNNSYFYLYPQWQDVLANPGVVYKHGSNNGFGSDYTDTNVTNGQIYTLASLATTGIRAYGGYNFVGWNCNNNIGNLSAGDSFEWNYSTNVICTARWEPINYTISYDCDDDGSVDTTATATYGSSFTFYDGSSICSNGDYIFNGWECNNYGSKSSEETITWGLASNDTCIAQWREDGAYTVTFDCNGGEETGGYEMSQDILLGDHLTFPDATENDMCTYGGYVFSSWICDNAGQWSGGEEITWDTEDNDTCYAQWEPNEYELNYSCGEDWNGNPADVIANAETTVNIAVGDNISLTDGGEICELPGAFFAGWICVGDGSGSDYDIEGTGTYEAEENVTCTANCEPYYYDVRINCGEDSMDTWYFAYTDEFELSYACDGFDTYNWTSWECESDNGEWSDSFEYDDAYFYGMPFADNITCTATGEPRETNITYECGEESSGGDTDTATYGNSYTFADGNSICTSPGTGMHVVEWYCEGQDWGGWYDYDNAYETDPFDIDESELVCTAQWSDVYIIYQRCNDDRNYVYRNGVQYGYDYEIYNHLCNKRGHTLSGWTCDNGIQALSGTYNVATNTTCNASWTANNYNIVYSCGSGSGAEQTDSVTYGSSYTFAGANICSNANGSFVGWNCSNGLNIVSANEYVNSWNNTTSITCTAIWDNDTYTVSFRPEEDAVPDPEDVIGSMTSENSNYGTAFTFPTNGFSTTGYRFDGWHCVGDSTGVENDYTDEETVDEWPYAEDVTCMTMWIPNGYNVEFNCNGGTGDDNNLAVYGATFWLDSGTTCAKTGYTFDGWVCTGQNTGWTQNWPSQYEIDPWNYDEDVVCRASWARNTIDITWYNDDVLMVVDSAAQQCLYGNTFTLPTAPSKPGFVFDGWTVKGCSLSGYNFGINASGYGFKNNNGGWFSNASTYGLAANDTWADSFSYGLLRGQSLCSATSGTYAGVGTPDISGAGDTKRCWCRATDFTPTNGDQCPVLSPQWVFLNDGDASGCANGCAEACGRQISSSPLFRSAIFGQNFSTVNMDATKRPFDYGAYSRDSNFLYGTTQFGLNTPSTFAAKYSLNNGVAVIYGEASCNTTQGNNYNETWTGDLANLVRPSGTFDKNSLGRECWCHLTGYQERMSGYGSSVIQDISANPWVFMHPTVPASEGDDRCPYICAYNCVSNFTRGESGRNAYRALMFGQTTQ